MCDVIGPICLQKGSIPWEQDLWRGVVLFRTRETAQDGAPAVAWARICFAHVLVAMTSLSKAEYLKKYLSAPSGGGDYEDGSGKEKKKKRKRDKHSKHSSGVRIIVEEAMRGPGGAKPGASSPTTDSYAHHG